MDEEIIEREYKQAATHMASMYKQSLEAREAARMRGRISAARELLEMCEAMKTEGRIYVNVEDFITQQ